MVQTSNTHHHHYHDHKTLVLKSAIYSRILVLSLIIFFRTLASPYDTSASLNPPCLTNTATPNNTHHSPITSAIENGIVWDSVFFVRSAQCGYEYEQSYAFLPLLPLSISFLSPSILSSFLPQRSLFALSAYIINNLAFVLAALYFYRYLLLFLVHNIYSLMFYYNWSVSIVVVNSADFL
jgi:phosphatidylinositol glycan class V